MESLWNNLLEIYPDIFFVILHVVSSKFVDRNVILAWMDLTFTLEFEELEPEEETDETIETIEDYDYDYSESRTGRTLKVLFTSFLNIIFFVT